MITEQDDDTEQKDTISPSSSLTSGTDVYMDAVDIINDHQSGQLFFDKVF
jgi:hypothetical protein